jgi:aryl-alcohol dehydrogenase-like predicted oxidoreductase
MTSARRPASRIGFGCASLGSRVGAKAGLAALAAAFDRGVNWFDLAPSYGDGHAEDIFAHFSRDRRSEIYICTKCGITPPQPGLIASALRPVARILVSVAPQLRKLVARGRAAPTRLPLLGGLIRESIECSLHRLGTDYVDVLALHDPDPAQLECEDLRIALQEVLAAGRAKAIGIAGSIEAADAALRLDLPIGYIQIASNPFFPQMDALARSIETAGKKIYVLTHSIFGQETLVRDIVRCVKSHSELNELICTRYGLPLEQSTRAALIEYARQTNSSGTVLFSMFSQKNREFNIGQMNAKTKSDVGPIFDAVRAILRNPVTLGSQT